MGVLHVEHRVLARLLHDLGVVEIQRRVVLAGEHDEAHHVLADFVDEVAERHKRPGALGHLHRFAVVEHPDHLAELDVELAFAVGERLQGGLHALDVAAVVGAPDVDQVLEAAVHLVLVVGDVAGEIGADAAGLLERAVDFIAELGGLEQQLGPGLPVVGGLALGRFQDAGVGEPGIGQEFQRVIDLAGFHQGLFRTEHIVVHAEVLQILAHQLHHVFHGEVPERRDPGGRVVDLGPFVAVAGLEGLGHRKQIGAAVLDFLALQGALHIGLANAAQGLQVAHAQRRGDVVHLSAGVVDVIFLGDREAGLGQEAREHVAHDRAAGVTHMHGAGGIGRDILDVDRFAGAGGAVAICAAFFQHIQQGPAPDGVIELDVDEARTGGGRCGHVLNAFQRLDQQLSQHLWRHAGGLGQHHGGVGGEVAHAGLARRLHRDAGEIEPGRKFTRGHQPAQDGVEAAFHDGEDVHRTMRPGPRNDEKWKTRKRARTL